MSRLKMEEVPFEMNGKTYILRCNMAVLEEVQEAFDGDIIKAMENQNGSVCVFLAAMLNDYADEQGWPERYSVKDVKRKVTMGMIMSADVIGLMNRSFLTEERPAEKKIEAAPETVTEGN